MTAAGGQQDGPAGPRDPSSPQAPPGPPEAASPSAGGAPRPATHAPTDAPSLQVQDLSFRFPGRPLFAGWSARFGPGLTWLRGANGSGKSTLLRLLGGALPPLAGQLLADGVDAAQQPLAYRRMVFWCGPDALAFGHLRPPEYFGFIAGLYPSLDAAGAQALTALTAALGLQPHLGKRLDQLSTGTQRKVAVAVALSVGTPVVLLDEPLAALDRASQAVVRQRLAGAARDRGQCWIVTSHEPLGEAAEAAARHLDLDAQPGPTAA